LAPRPQREAEVMVAVVDTREAAAIPAVVAAHIFQHPMAAAHISPLALRLTLVEAAHISPPAYLTVDLLFAQRFTVLRLQQRIML
jgi:hypothetical protein